ncbi:MAG: hypothetical protein M3R61_03040 [Chloroflexota bacterium]|nr:hypothetical protein [Chloroflexota bacterium]
MRRMIVGIVLLALVLAGCGGTPADTTVADPPRSKVIEASGNAQIDKLVADWKTAVPATMKKELVQDPIEEKVYQSDASLEEIDAFYKKLTETSWIASTRMPGIQNGVLLTGYDSGNTSLVIGAVDAKPLGGTGVIVYTAKGTK